MNKNEDKEPPPRQTFFDRAALNPCCEPRFSALHPGRSSSLVITLACPNLHLLLPPTP